MSLKQLVNDMYFKVCLAGNDKPVEQDVSDFISELSVLILSLPVESTDESVQKIIGIYTCLVDSGFLDSYILIKKNPTYNIAYDFGTEMVLRLKRIGNSNNRYDLIKKFKTRIIGIQFLRSFGIKSQVDSNIYGDLDEMLETMVGLTFKLKGAFDGGSFGAFAKTMMDKQLINIIESVKLL